jgi:MFS family permease
VWSVATGLFLVGLGWSASFLGATAIISDVTTAIERAGALGFTDSTTGLAPAVGGLCGGFVVDTTGFAVLGVTAAAMILPVVLLLLPLRELHSGQWTKCTKEPASG